MTLGVVNPRLQGKLNQGPGLNIIFSSRISREHLDCISTSTETSACFPNAAVFKHDTYLKHGTVGLLFNYNAELPENLGTCFITLSVLQRIRCMEGIQRSLHATRSRALQWEELLLSFRRTSHLWREMGNPVPILKHNPHAQERLYRACQYSWSSIRDKHME